MPDAGISSDKPKSVRISPELVQAATVTAARERRSAAEQINYWAAVGRRVTAATGVDQRRLDRVVSGEAQFAELTDAERVIAHARIDVAIEQRAAQTPLGELARLEGVTTVTMDDDGRLVKISPDGTTRRL
jgi:hypothetical protein